MFASRVFSSLFAVSALALTASAVPLSSNETATASVEKRITHDGQGTWFDVGLGACGYYNENSDSIVAISHDIYGSGGNCNQWIHITNTANGNNGWAQVRDECMGCAAGSLDMSPSFFSQLADLSEGVIQISWHYENRDFTPPN